MWDHELSKWEIRYCDDGDLLQIIDLDSDYVVGEYRQGSSTIQTVQYLVEQLLRFNHCNYEITDGEIHD